jgi:hypothetical protein
MLPSDVRHAIASSPSSSTWSISMPDLVFFLIQLDLRRHPTSLVTIAVLANRSKNIGIHLSVSRVRYHPLGFNSSGNFCDRRVICSRGAFYATAARSQSRHKRPSCSHSCGCSDAVAQTRAALRGQTSAFFIGREPSNQALRDKEVKGKERSDVRAVYAAEE